MASVRQVTGVSTDATLGKLYPDAAMDANTLYLIDLSNSECRASGTNPAEDDVIHNLVAAGANGVVKGNDMTESGGGFLVPKVAGHNGVVVPASILSAIYANAWDFVTIGWFKVPAITPVGNFVLMAAGRNHGTPPVLWQVYMQSGRLDTVAIGANNVGSYNDNDAWSAGAVHQIAVAVEGDVLKAFIDGVEIPKEFDDAPIAKDPDDVPPDVSAIGSGLADGPDTMTNWPANLGVRYIYRQHIAKLPGGASDRTAAEVVAADYAAVISAGNFS